MRQFISSKRPSGQGAHHGIALLCLFLSLFTATALQAGSGGSTFRYGAVFTRGLVLGPSNQPIYVEYDDQGAQGTEIGEAVGPLAHAPSYKNSRASTRPSGWSAWRATPPIPIS